jgi:hypothetical protein
MTGQTAIGMRAFPPTMPEVGPFFTQKLDLDGRVASSDEKQVAESPSLNTLLAPHLPLEPGRETFLRSPP